MLSKSVIDYAESVLGFYIYLDMQLEMEEEVTDVDKDGVEFKFGKGSHAILRSFKIEPLPNQLTVVVEILSPEGRSLLQTFTEDDMDPQFPFAPPKTPEEIEMERIEREEREAKKKAEDEKKAKEKEDREALWADRHGYHHHGRGYH